MCPRLSRRAPPKSQNNQIHQVSGTKRNFNIRKRINNASIHTFFGDSLILDIGCMMITDIDRSISPLRDSTIETNSLFFPQKAIKCLAKCIWPKISSPKRRATSSNLGNCGATEISWENYSESRATRKIT